MDEINRVGIEKEQTTLCLISLSIPLLAKP